ITLPQKLLMKLREKAEETDSLPEELGVELILKGLNEELDPEGLVEHYQALSDKYIDEAKEFLKKGDLVQTSEKLWGASALAVKRIAASRGLKLDKHGAIWSFVSKLSKESGDEDIVVFFGDANALHKNFYENEMDKDAVEILLGRIEKLIVKLSRIS
ncbi:MAG: PaREP1 family protein, partial [Candidatus Methanospirareceae archaeon]